MTTMFGDCFYGKTVLVTGHTGFKGSWLCMWLSKLGAKVVGYSDKVPSLPSHFAELSLGEAVEDHRGDVCDLDKLRRLITETKPDFIFHLAAQAIVRPSYVEPLLTMKTNSIGSATILQAAREIDKFCVVVMVTSDKVYDNVEWNWGYRETDSIGGKDPYSASKGMAELAIKTMLFSYFMGTECQIRIGIGRAGNVIGGGDWAKDRIVPDCMRAWAESKAVEVRGQVPRDHGSTFLSRLVATCDWRKFLHLDQTATVRHIILDQQRTKPYRSRTYRSYANALGQGAMA